MNTIFSAAIHTYYVSIHVMAFDVVFLKRYVKMISYYCNITSSKFVNGGRCNKFHSWYSKVICIGGLNNA